MLQLRAKVGSLHYIVAEKEVAGSEVELRISGTPLTYAFAFKDVKSGGYSKLASLDTRYLSTEVAGGFTGVMIGLYASSNGKATKAKAFFDWFDYQLSS
ncbi:hypothetical protein D3C72_1961860 [compost metagenome]